VTSIKFGTSGWRAVISDEFTFENVRLVTQAIADYVNSKFPSPALRTGKKQSSPRLRPLSGRLRSSGQAKSVIVGYDTRFLSREFAQEAAKVLSSNGIKVLLPERDLPTPVISYEMIKKDCACGMNFTASHNPPQYNGIKFSSETGGPATPDITERIEKNIIRLQKKRKTIPSKGCRRLIERCNPHRDYLRHIERLIDFNAIKRARLRIAVDCLYGTSREYLDFLLKKHGLKPIVIRDYLNPSFDGRRPEPAPENITELISIVKGQRLNLGLATDGDADRFGIIDSDGTYITPNQVITLLFHHLLKTRKSKRKMVARTIATTHMIDAIAGRHNIEVVETPVGFKYFVDMLNDGRCIIAGEESGGLSISGHTPEKDGILACLLIAEMVAVNRKSIRRILSSIHRTYGWIYSDRVNLALPQKKKKILVERLKSKKLKSFAGLKIIRRDLRDGCKLYLEDGSWILFRPSGTEPIVRSYFESKSKRVLKKLLRAGKRISRF